MQPTSLQRGDRIAGRYQVLEQKAETSLWVGYLAHDLGEQRASSPHPDVMVKVVRPELVAEPGAAERLARDLQRMKGLQHPGLPPLLHVHLFEPLRTVALIEPKKAGLSQSVRLRRMLTMQKKERFSLDEVRQLGAQLASVLSYVHGQARFHGDLRPETIRLAPEGCRLCDLGLGAGLPRRAYLEAVGRIHESEFIAPEIRQGAQPDGRADVYSLAALYQYLLSFGNGEEWEAVLAEKPAMQGVLARGMHQDPAQRYGSIESFLVEIEAVARTGQPLRKRLSFSSIILSAPVSRPPQPDAQQVSASLSGTQLASLDGKTGGVSPDAPSDPVSSRHKRLPEFLDGWLGVDAPLEMPVETTAMVRAVAIRDLLQEALVEEALQQKNKQAAPERLARMIRMELVSVRAKDFQVRALSPAEQPVRADELTVWEWLITAQRPGAEKLLLLTVTDLLDEKGRSLGKALPSRRIEVQVLSQRQPQRPIFNTEGLRKLLNSVVKTDAELDALIRNHFPQVRFLCRHGMDRAARVDLVLARAPAYAVLNTLRMEHPAQFEEQAAAHALSIADAPDALSPTVTAESSPILRPLAPTGAASSPAVSPLAAQPPPRSLPTMRWRWAAAVLALPLVAALASQRFGIPVTGSPQAPGRAHDPISGGSLDAPVRLGTGYAVLFATARYEDPRWPQLKTPARDASQIAGELRTIYGFSVEQIEDPSVAEIRRQIRRLAERKYEDGDQLLLMFSGHGDKDEALKEGWVIARDSRTDDRQSAYPYSELREDIDRIPCRHILLILDVGSGGLSEPGLRDAQVSAEGSKESTPEGFIGRKLRQRSRLYISSIAQKTEAPEGQAHSPLAGRFLAALRSRGGADGVLAWSELVGFLGKLDPEPRGGVFPGTASSDPGGDFLFVVKSRPAR
jgi:serine/threonine protein kinase